MGSGRRFCGRGFAFADVQAQAYPSRPIRWIVPFPPGGSTDIYSRVLAPKVSEALGQQIVIDNRAGAGGALGAELAAKSPADGYTIWMGQTNNLAISPALRIKGNYDPLKDFAPITLVQKSPSVRGECRRVYYVDQGAGRRGQEESGRAYVRIGGRGQQRPHQRRAFQHERRHRDHARAVTKAHRPRYWT